MDELAGEVKRAVELIAACRKRLETTDREVRDLVAKLEPDEAPAPAVDADVDADVPF